MKNFLVEDIIEDIRSQVENRKSIYSSSLVNKLNMGDKNIIKHKNINFKFKNVYVYSDFTKYYDKYFIDYLYRALLKRKPDIEGFNYYLNLLRSGKKSKTEIISIIRYSKEGRQKNVKLLGRRKRYLYTVLLSIPILGYFFKMLIFFVKAPKYLERINAMENCIFKESDFNYINSTLLEKELIKQDKEVKKIKTLLKQIKELL